MRVVIIGTGLIGTSIALALRERGAEVWLADSDPAAARLAADLGAGVLLPDELAEPADIAVIAVPPAAVAASLAQAQARRLARCYTDVASVKQLPAAQAAERGCDLASYVPGHPLAGREKHGPAAARADLFLGRTWALCPAAADLAGSRRDGHRAGPGLRRGPGAHRPRRARPLGGAHLARPAPGLRGHGGPARDGPAAGPGPGRAGAARRDQDRGRGHRPVDADPYRQRRAGRRGAGRGGRRPGRGGPDAGRRRRIQVSRRACSTAARRVRPGFPASTAARQGSSPWSRWSSPTSPASWPGCSRPPAPPASTSRTSGSSTRPACRSAWRSCRSAPAEVTTLLEALEAGGWPVRR